MAAAAGGNLPTLDLPGGFRRRGIPLDEIVDADRGRGDHGASNKPRRIRYNRLLHLTPFALSLSKGVGKSLWFDKLTTNDFLSSILFEPTPNFLTME